MAELGADQVCKRPPASQRVWRVCSPWPAKLAMSCVRWLAASRGSVVSFRHSTEAKQSLAPARSSEAPANKQKSPAICATSYFSGESCAFLIQAKR